MDEASQPEPPQADDARKRPYEPPRIEESSSFQRLVLRCSFTAGTECELEDPFSVM